MVQVFINGENREVPGELNLRQLLTVLALPAQQIAIELNREVISRRNWEATPINEEDRIEVIHFVGGG